MISHARTSTRVGAVVLAATLSLSGCSGEKGASGSDEIQIAFANYTNNSELFAPVSDSVKKAGEHAGMNVKLYDNKGTAEAALENAQLIAQQQPDVAIEYSPDPAIGKSLFAAFDQAGIKCIALNVLTEGCYWLNVINQKLGTASGEIAAKYATEHGWDGTNTTILLANSPKSGSEVNDTVRYMYTTVADKVPGFKVIDPAEFTESTTRISENAVVIDGGATADTAFAAVQSALQNIPAGQNIIYSSNNDDKALGGWQAIVEAGRDQNAIVIGQGGSKVALEQLTSNPQWVGEIDALLSVWGYYAVAMADAIHAGEEPPELTELPFVALTKENLAEYYDPNDLSHPKSLPPAVDSNEYLWGRDILEKYGK